MSSRHSKLHILLLLVSYLCTIHTSASSNTAVPCFPADAAALLQLKRSFLSPNLTSWRGRTDCCRWEAVACDAASGRVIALDLGERNLQCRGLDPALFNLTSLRNLSLADTDFTGGSLPSVGFELLTEMVHLNFSYSTNLIGQIPIGIAWLRKLVTLDFSSYPYSYLFLKEPSFQTLIANLSSVRELRLDGVDISSSGETWSIALANSIPRLQILSLSECGLSGSIHHSLSRLSSLVEIDLYRNNFAGVVPEFFADFPLLTTLDLSRNNFDGQFPTKIFQLKHLTFLLVSFNAKLSGHLPSFPVENKLEWLSLQYTNFSDAMPVSIVNLKSLKYLAITTEGISKDLALIGKLPSLDDLQLQGSSSLEKPQFSWIGDLRHLTSLMIENYNFNMSIPSWIGNLTNLMDLFLRGCNFYGPIPPWIGNLTQLSLIDFSMNYLTGQIPRSLFSLAELELLYLSSNQLSGTVELSSFWRLKNLFALSLSHNMLSVIDEQGDSMLPSLPNIEYLELASCNLTKLPGVLQYLDEIEWLDLSSNHISGVIPGWIWEKCEARLRHLNLSNNMFTSL